MPVCEAGPAAESWEPQGLRPAMPWPRARGGPGVLLGRPDGPGGQWCS